MQALRIENNAAQIGKKYQIRVASLTQHVTGITVRYALVLHEIRKKNLQRLLYDKTPWPGPPKPVTRRLIDEGEKVAGNAVYNDTPYAILREEMTGDYARVPGLTREAHWVEVSLVEFVPIYRTAMVSNFRKGLSAA